MTSGVAELNVTPPSGTRLRPSYTRSSRPIIPTTAVKEATPDALLQPRRDPDPDPKSPSTALVGSRVTVLGGSI